MSGGGGGERQPVLKAAGRNPGVILQKRLIHPVSRRPALPFGFAL